MIARAAHSSHHPAPGSPGLVGNKVPRPHRFHLTDGRVIEGDMHRSPGSRLADHLSTLKGFISTTNASCTRSGTIFPYLVVNMEHVLFIEEIPDREPQPMDSLTARTAHVSR
jgi:hypothetical protein